MIWSSPPETFLLEPGEVHLWRLNLRPEQVQLSELEQFLAPDELERAERFHNLENRTSFVAGRGYLRFILGQYLGLSPRDLDFAYNRFGKPGLGVNTSRHIQFNLSHARNLGLLAVCLNEQVGVDVEYMQPGREIRKIARRFFSPGEMAEIEALPDHLQDAACYQLWSCKEALLKAHGLGLSIGGDRFQISLVRGGRPRIIKGLNEEGNIGNWSLSLIDPGPDYTGALAVRAKKFQLRLFHFSM